MRWILRGLNTPASLRMVKKYDPYWTSIVSSLDDFCQAGIIP